MRVILSERSDHLFSSSKRVNVSRSPSSQVSRLSAVLGDMFTRRKGCMPLSARLGSTRDTARFLGIMTKDMCSISSGRNKSSLIWVVCFSLSITVRFYQSQ